MRRRRWAALLLGVRRAARRRSLPLGCAGAWRDRAAPAAGAGHAAVLARAGARGGELLPARLRPPPRGRCPGARPRDPAGLRRSDQLVVEVDVSQVDAGGGRGADASATRCCLRSSRSMRCSARDARAARALRGSRAVCRPSQLQRYKPWFVVPADPDDRARRPRATTPRSASTASSSIRRAARSRSRVSRRSPRSSRCSTATRSRSRS